MKIKIKWKPFIGLLPHFYPPPSFKNHPPLSKNPFFPSQNLSQRKAGTHILLKTIVVEKSLTLSSNHHYHPNFLFKKNSTFHYHNNATLKKKKLTEKNWHQNYKKNTPTTTHLSIYQSANYCGVSLYESRIVHFMLSLFIFETIYLLIILFFCVLNHFFTVSSIIYFLLHNMT